MTNPTDRIVRFYRLVARVMITPPIGNPQILTLMREVYDDFVPIERSRLRTEVIQYLDQHDILFGMTIGPLTITQTEIHPGLRRPSASGDTNEP